MINVTCSLQEKNSIYQAVLSYKEDNKWKTKWVSTKIKATKKNKREAELKLEDIKNNFYSKLNKNCFTNNNNYANNFIPIDTDIFTTSNQFVESKEKNILFIDFMKSWLQMIKSSIEESTYSGYENIINGKMSTYFQKTNITVQNIKPTDIQKFYQFLINLGLSGNTVQHYHANIRKALQYAVKIEIIESNPADKVDLPKSTPYSAEYYTRNEILSLFNVVKNTKLETPVLLAAFYGLRRSEIVGLKWDAIDFENKTISIKHVVTQTSENHTGKIVKKDRTKTKSSTRTLPLLPKVEKYLLHLKKTQYNPKNSEYICLNDHGDLILPNYITSTFRKLLIKNNLKIVRFHDLRHSVASLLLNEGINMKQIQIWLGHSNYSTTANIYAHLDSKSMEQSAITISNILGKVS